MMLEGTDTQEKRDTIDQAIRIEEINQAGKEIKTSLLGRLYYCKATMEHGLENYKEARRAYS